MKIKRQSRKEKNRGFSLVELLVVIAIISILAGVCSVGMSLANSRNAEKCARLIDSAFESARMSSLSQEGTFFLLLDGENHRLTITSSVNGVVEEIPLPARVNVETEVNGTSLSEAGTVLRVEFDKSGGGIRALSLGDSAGVSAVDINSFHTVTVTAENDSGSREARVLLIRRTGKHYVEF